MFAFGLVGFLVVAALLERYDQERGTNTVWLYGGLVLLIYAISHQDQLVKQLRALSRGETGTAQQVSKPKPNTGLPDRK